MEIKSGDSIIFNDWYGENLEGKKAIVEEVFGSFGNYSFKVSGFDSKHPTTTTQVRRNAFFTIEELYNKYDQIKSVVEHFVDIGLISTEQYKETLSELNSKESIKKFK